MGRCDEIPNGEFFRTFDQPGIIVEAWRRCDNPPATCRA